MQYWPPHPCWCHPTHSLPFHGTLNDMVFLTLFSNICLHFVSLYYRPHFSYCMPIMQLQTPFRCACSLFLQFWISIVLKSFLPLFPYLTHLCVLFIITPPFNPQSRVSASITRMLIKQRTNRYSILFKKKAISKSFSFSNISKCSLPNLKYNSTEGPFSLIMHLVISRKHPRLLPAIFYTSLSLRVWNL